MMLSDVLPVVRRYLSDPVGLRNKVGTHITGQVSFLFPLKNIAAGTTFSSGLQTFYVWDVNSGSETAYVDVIQGAATLLPTGATVRVSPRYTDYDIMQAINDGLASLSSPANGLFQMKSLDLTYSNTLIGYDLGATDVQSIYEIRTATPGPYKDWPMLAGGSGFRLDRVAPTTDFPSGTSLNLWAPGYQGYDVRVVYRADYGTFGSLTDTVASVGLQSSAVDLAAISAAINLMSGKEIARNLTDRVSDTRRATEVPAGAVANSVNGLRALRQQRIAEEAARLSILYPPHRAD